MGGALAAVEKGFFQDEIRTNAYQLKQEIDKHERIIVGVNKFQDSSSVEPNLNLVDSTIEGRQVTRLKEFKNSRDRSKVDAALNKLTTVAEGQDNVMPHIVNAIKYHVTLGEINNSFKQVFGSYQPRISF